MCGIVCEGLKLPKLDLERCLSSCCEHLQSLDLTLYFRLCGDDTPPSAQEINDHVSANREFHVLNHLTCVQFHVEESFSLRSEFLEWSLSGTATELLV